MHCDCLTSIHYVPIMGKTYWEDMKMAVFRKHEDPEVKITGVGFWRRFPIIGWRIPYVYGSDIVFRVTPKQKPTGDKPLLFTWVLSRWDGQNQFIVNQDGGEFDKGKNSKKIDVGYLSITGHHILDMRWGEDISNKKNQIMVNFTLLDRDTYAVNWIFNLTSGILGAIIGAVIALAVTGNDGG